ncbi:type IV toxin-antitoxin system AbiEi family antitoxin [Desulfobacterota bacterium M19]
MQPIKQLAVALGSLADPEHFLFSLSDLSGLLPDLSTTAFKALIGRAVKSGILQRVCRGIYLYPVKDYPAGMLLYKVAARLRAHEFNYISLESVLSDAGVISQIPMNWITLMSSGRSHIVDCGDFGHIEFIHTKKTLAQLESHLLYDRHCGLWRSSVAQALQDMKFTGRNTDLVDWRVVRELI